MSESVATVREKILRFVRWDYFPFVVFGVLMFLFLFFTTAKFGDDVIWMKADHFVNIPLKNGFWAFETSVYKTWSPRMIIYPIMVALCQAPILIWRMLDVAIWLMIGVCLSKLFIRNPQANWFLVGCMLLYPYWHLSTTGWIATTCNFSWPLALGLFVLLTVKRAWEGQRLSWFRYLLCVPAFLYAVDAEQMCLIFVAITGVLTAKTVLARCNMIAYSSAGGGLVLLLFGLSLARLAFTLACPGSYSRFATEQASFFPAFATLSLCQKLVLGFELAMTHYTICMQALFPCFAFLLLLQVCRKYPDAWRRCIAAIPLVTSIVLTIHAVTRAYSIRSELLAAGSAGKGFLAMIFIRGLPSGPGLQAFFLVFFAALLLALWWVCNNFSDRWILIGITLLGFGTQWMIGLSPSLYNSVYRTFFYAAFGIIICAVWLYEKVTESRPFGRFVKNLFVLVCVSSYGVTVLVSMIRAFKGG